VPAPPPPPPPPPPPGNPSPPPPPLDKPYCIFCNEDDLEKLMSEKCGVQSAVAFQIFDSAVAGPISNLPCYKLVEYSTTAVSTWTMTKLSGGQVVNYLNDQGWVDCSKVKQVSGDSSLEFRGNAPSGDPCLMPSTYLVVIPTIPSPAPARGGPAAPSLPPGPTPPSPAPRQSPRARRIRRSRRGGLRRTRLNQTVLQEPPWPYALPPQNGGY
jgi:hypothetical protein